MEEQRRRRLCIVFPAGRLRHVSQVAALLPTATSIQLPRSVDCQWNSEHEARAEYTRLLASHTGTEQTLCDVALLADSPPGTSQSAGGLAAPEVRVRTLKDLTRLYVRGVHRDATADQLRRLFSGCTAVTIPTNNRRGNNGFAFVQFADRSAAADFVNERRSLLLLGKRLTVGYALERDSAKASSSCDDAGRFVSVHVDLQLARAGRIAAARVKERQECLRRQQEHRKPQRRLEKTQLTADRPTSSCPIAAVPSTTSVVCDPAVTSGEPNVAQSNSCHPALNQNTNLTCLPSDLPYSTSSIL